MPQLQAPTVACIGEDGAASPQGIFLSFLSLTLVGSEGQILITALQVERKSFCICPNPTSASFPVTLVAEGTRATQPLCSHRLAFSQQAGVRLQGHSPGQEIGNIWPQITSTCFRAHRSLLAGSGALPPPCSG